MIIGFIGIGKMGSRIVKKLVAGNHVVHVWNRSPSPIEALYSQGIQVSQSLSIEKLVQNLTSPKIIWLMLPQGEATQSLYEHLLPLLHTGDILIDGGNAKFSDTERRFTECSQRGIRFLGIGVSGGIIAETNGYPLMVGGDKSAYEDITPLLDTLAKPNGGHEYCGSGGAGHYAKMVHNGIEYGIMQSLSEGFAVLGKSEYNFDLVKIAKIYQKGSLISGFMLDRLVDTLESNPRLEGVVGSIDATGEAEWTVEEAARQGTAVEIIKSSLNYRTRSKTDPEIQSSFTARCVAALRAAFGGHSVVKK